jgi:CPA1 family monovalent cation:H+ antiporter
MIWGGLRGVITLALVLSLPVELDYWWTIQSIGFGVVLFTLIVQSTTNPLLVKKLKLNR